MKLKSSNCLIEAMKAKIKSPKTVTIHCVWGSKSKYKKRLHFMWSDGVNDYDFVPISRFYFPLIFIGRIKTHPLGSIQRYQMMCKKKYRKVGIETNEY